VFCLDQLFFIFFCFSLDTFDQSLFLLDGSLFDRQTIFGFDLCNLFLTPEATEFVANSIVSGLGQTRVLAFAEFIVTNSDLPDL
jgi:hypothetical protein